MAMGEQVLLRFDEGDTPLMARPKAVCGHEMQASQAQTAGSTDIFDIDEVRGSFNFSMCCWSTTYPMHSMSFIFVLGP